MPIGQRIHFSLLNFSHFQIFLFSYFVIRIFFFTLFFSSSASRKMCVSHFS